MSIMIFVLGCSTIIVGEPTPNWGSTNRGKLCGSLTVVATNVNYRGATKQWHTKQIRGVFTIFVVLPMPKKLYTMGSGSIPTRDPEEKNRQEKATVSQPATQRAHCLVAPRESGKIPATIKSTTIAVVRTPILPNKEESCHPVIPPWPGLSKANPRWVCIR